MISWYTWHISNHFRCRNQAHTHHQCALNYITPFPSPSGSFSCLLPLELCAILKDVKSEFHGRRDITHLCSIYVRSGLGSFARLYTPFRLDECAIDFWVGSGKV